MRITLTIDDDVHAAAKEMAWAQQKSVGEVISALARLGLALEFPDLEAQHGLSTLERRGTRVPLTAELTKQLDEELF